MSLPQPGAPDVKELSNHALRKEVADTARMPRDPNGYIASRLRVLDAEVQRRKMGGYRPC